MTIWNSSRQVLPESSPTVRSVKEQNPPPPFFFLWLKTTFLVLWLITLSRASFTELSWFVLARTRGLDEAFDFYALTLMWSMRSQFDLKCCRSSTWDVWDASMANRRYLLESRWKLPWFSFWLWVHLNHEAALGIKTSVGSTPKL